MKFGLNAVQRIYDWWGQHSLAFRIAAWAAFMGRESGLRCTAARSLFLQQGDTVLDLACGNGANLAFLEECVGPWGSLLAFDYNRHMLDAAQQRIARQGWENIQLVQGDAAKLCLQEGSLDGALCSLALSVIPDHRTAIERVHRALKPGKRFAVLDAHLFEGVWRLLNPVLIPVGEWATGWDTSKDLIGDLHRAFGQVDVRMYNGGSIFLGVATKVERFVGKSPPTIPRIPNRRMGRL
jgi:SAM-dependent methyltransferase